MEYLHWIFVVSPVSMKLDSGLLLVGGRLHDDAAYSFTYRCSVLVRQRFVANFGLVKAIKTASRDLLHNQARR